MGPGMMGGSAMGPGMMEAWGTAANPWWGAAALVFSVLIVAGVALLSVWAVRRVHSVQNDGPQPLEILKDRYVRGEITLEQYEQMSRNLEPSRLTSISPRQ